METESVFKRAGEDTYQKIDWKLPMLVIDCKLYALVIDWKLIVLV